jgi:hypothetical protein
VSTETEFTYKGTAPRSGSPAMERAAPGANWVLFAGIMLALVGILNLIYGIAAISKSNFFDDGAEYIVSSLRTWGWVGVVLGAVQLLAASSVWRGGSFGRWFGIALASLSLIAALMSVSSSAFWSLTIAALDVLIIYGLAAYGGQHRPV